MSSDFNSNSVPGWFDFHGIYNDRVNEATTLAESVFVEIGTCLGRSACYMGELIKAYKKPIKFYTVDPFDESILEQSIVDFIAYMRRDKAMEIPMEDLARMFVNKCGLQDHVKVIKGESVTFSKKFNNDSVDFVFIDGNHEYESVKADIKSWWPKLKFNHWIGGHDYGLPSVSRAVKDVFGNKGIVEINGSWMKFKNTLSL